MTAAPVPSRRERLRAQTLAEIRDHGYAQIADGGAAALSLNGIAKAMGMSGPAMYRYFDSRDELLATLVAESYEDLAHAFRAASDGARRRTPRARLAAVCDAYRAWALAEPHRYRLVFASTYGSGSLDPDHIIPPARRVMDVILDVLAELPGLVPPPVADATLRRDLRRWGQTTNRPDAAPGLFLLGQVTWSRLHGILGLEIEGVYAQMGIDPGRLYAREVERIADEATGAPG